MFLSGSALGQVDANGDPVHDDDLVLVLLLNGWAEDLPFHVPQRFGAGEWSVLMDTRTGTRGEEPVLAGSTTTVGCRSLQLLARPLTANGFATPSTGNS